HPPDRDHHHQYQLGDRTRTAGGQRQVPAVRQDHQRRGHAQYGQGGPYPARQRYRREHGERRHQVPRVHQRGEQDRRQQGPARPAHHRRRLGGTPYPPPQRGNGQRQQQVQRERPGDRYRVGGTVGVAEQPQQSPDGEPHPAGHGQPVHDRVGRQVAYPRQVEPAGQGDRAERGGGRAEVQAGPRHAAPRPGGGQGRG